MNLERQANLVQMAYLGQCIIVCRCNFVPVADEQYDYKKIIMDDSMVDFK